LLPDPHLLHRCTFSFLLPIFPAGHDRFRTTGR
jgi:hypothetical protein